MKSSLTRRLALLIASALILPAIGASFWLVGRAQNRIWAKGKAIAQVDSLLSHHKPLAAFLLLQNAQKYLPHDSRFAALLATISNMTSVRSSPPGALVQIKDGLFPGEVWSTLGTTPLDNIRVPTGPLLWRVSKAGFGQYSGAPIDFDTGSGTFFVLAK